MGQQRYARVLGSSGWVYACVQVTPVCRAVEVDNPNAATLGVLLLSVDDEETDVVGDGELTTLPANQTVTIPWTGRDAWVLALAQDAWDGSTSFLSLASSFGADGDPLTVEVPQNCRQPGGEPPWCRRGRAPARR